MTEAPRRAKISRAAKDRTIWGLLTVVSTPLLVEISQTTTVVRNRSISTT